MMDVTMKAPTITPEQCKASGQWILFERKNIESALKWFMESPGEESWNALFSAINAFTMASMNHVDIINTAYEELLNTLSGYVELFKHLEERIK